MEPVRVDLAGDVKKLEATTEEMARTMASNYHEAVRIRITTVDSTTTIAELYAEP